MAHDLDFSRGDAAFVELSTGDRVSAWHQLGRTVRPEQFEGMNAEEKAQLIMQAGRLDWTVDKLDVRDEDGVTLKGWKAFRRSDTDKLFGVYRDSYTILQNTELFELVAPMIDEGMVTFETAGAIREGSDVWAMFRFNPDNDAVSEFFEQETIIPYLLLANNHDYKRLISIQQTMIRVVCKNTLSAATGAFGESRRSAGRYPGTVRLRHTRNVKSLSVDAVQELWGDMTNRYIAVQESYAALKMRHLQWEEFETNVLDIVAPLPEIDALQPSKQFRATFERAFDRRHLVTALYRGAGRGINGNETAWNAYMATTEALDHYEEAFPTRGDRLQAIYQGGSLANKKQDVLNSLTALTV